MDGVIKKHVELSAGRMAMPPSAMQAKVDLETSNASHQLQIFNEFGAIEK
jgi:hypothetical protein